MTQQQNIWKDSTTQQGKDSNRLDKLKTRQLKRLNRIEMAHPLAKVFSWIKSLKHIPLFDLASSLESWLDDHPTINQILNLML